MRVPRVTLATVVRVALVLALIAGSAMLFSKSDRPFTTQDKAYYADANTINFVRPGLVIKIVTASIADDGTVKVRFKLTDPKNLPLDKDGITTPGDISASLRFVIGYIPQGEKQYKSYLLRSVTSSITNQTATQVTSDTTGTYEKVADGEYVYTFKAKVPAGFDKHATHSIGMWGGRDLSEFDLAALKNYDSDVYTFVPDGSAVVTTRDVIRTQSCEKCHDPMQAHDERRSMELCIICHQPQSVDPDTGNTVDMAVFIHKIHMGNQLPSVKAGGKYQIIGYRNTVFDFSTVAFPADPRRCTFCHEQNTGAAQATAYLNPNRAACGSCHDDVNFQTGANHSNLPQISDRQCAGCHIPQGELEFDASIMGAHVIPEFSSQLRGLVYTIVDVKDGVAGKKPIVTFTVKDKQGVPYTDITKMRVRLVLAGPDTDYPSYAAEDASKAPGAGGTYTYTFTAAIPANATGTYTIGMEGYNSTTINNNTVNQLSVRDAALNSQVHFSVDGSKLAPRRQVVSNDKCNSCHGFLSAHGGNRNRVEECILCHNPNTVDGSKPANTVQFAYMIHRIHTGEESDRPYKIGSFDATEVRYPGDRRNCSACHVNGSEQLPLDDGMLNVNYPAGVLNPMGPTTAACTGCHTTTPAASHALSNTTTQLGEACAACHSTGYEFGVPKIHAR